MIVVFDAIQAMFFTMTGLDAQLIAEFVENGVVVIPSVIDRDEIRETLKELSNFLIVSGCDPCDLSRTAGALSKLSSTNGAGGILDVFYEDWKLRLNEHPRIVSSIQDLWLHTYAQFSPDDGEDATFGHPFGSFDPAAGYMYIDRVCYRVPSDVSSQFGPTKKKQLQRSLTPHLDCCPHDIYGKGSKWRPIQAFLCLTDTLLPDHGGFEACPGHHLHFAEWAEKRSVGAARPGGEAPAASPPCVGDFTPIRPIEDKDVLEKFRHIACKAGDLVCWVCIRSLLYSLFSPFLKSSLLIS